MQRGRVAAAIEEQHHLLASLQPPGDLLLQFPGKNRRALFLARFLAHVDDPHQRHFLVVGALRQFEQGVFPFLRVVETFQRGGGRAEQDHCAFHLTAHDSDIARVVTRRFLLLVGMLVFLIDNNEPERVHRRKNRRARPNDDARAALTDLVPLIVPLAGGQMAVQHRNERLQRTGAESPLEPFDRLRRERDFRHQHDRAFSLLQAMGDGLQINFGLAAARDAVEEEGEGAAGVPPAGLTARGGTRRLRKRDAGFRALHCRQDAGSTFARQIEAACAQLESVVLQARFGGIVLYVSAKFMILSFAANQVVKILVPPKCSLRAQPSVRFFCSE